MKLNNINPRKLGMFMFAALVAILGLVFTTGNSNVSTAHAGHNAVGNAEFGFTDGWQNGKTVQFSYHKPFFCKQPPASGATSGCEVGEEAVRAPRAGKIPTLYVMTPLGFRPDESTLQCPVIGQCINHPSTIDLSRALGLGAENLPLPAHSHIVDSQLSESQGNGGQAGWWELEIVGVTDLATWNEIAQAKSLEKVRELQAREGAGITEDIATNAFLFFGVKK